MTARWGITPNVILNATVNPDFSQVEADVAQLDVNTRFALFYPEKRPFFLEGIDFFATPLNTVFTRTIVDPLGGLKLTGKSGANAYGVFVARDEVNNIVLPSNQGSDFVSQERGVTSAVARYRRDVGSTSTVGAIYTGREGGTYHNRALRRGRVPAAGRLRHDPRAGAGHADGEPGRRGGPRRPCGRGVRRARAVRRIRARRAGTGSGSPATRTSRRASARTSASSRAWTSGRPTRTWAAPSSGGRAAGSASSRPAPRGSASRTTTACSPTRTRTCSSNYQGPQQSVANLQLHRTKERYAGQLFEYTRFDGLFELRPSGDLRLNLDARVGRVGGLRERTARATSCA